MMHPAGNADLPKITLSAPDGARAEVYLYGAHVTSWTPAGGREALFLSPKAEFRPGVAIRGGVPLIFPQFADLGSLPKHGFARTRVWEQIEAAPGQAVLRLREDEASLRLWPQRFELEYSVRMSGKCLELALKVSNPGPAAFDFNAALHSYLRVADLRQVSIHGLQGLQFSDSAHPSTSSPVPAVLAQAGQAGGRAAIQHEDLLTFPGEIDRMYFRAAAPLELRDGQQTLRLEQSGFVDVVAWNPGPEKCAALKDMQPDGYLQFVCIEAAVVEKPVTLAAGESWTGMQRLIASPCFHSKAHRG